MISEICQFFLDMVQGKKPILNMMWHSMPKQVNVVGYECCKNEYMMIEISEKQSFEKLYEIMQIVQDLSYKSIICSVRSSLGRCEVNKKSLLA